MKKIFITGGHPTPALALIEKLQKTDVKIYFVGRKYHVEGSKSISPEYTNLSKRINFLTIHTGRLQRHLSLHTLPSILKIPFGFLESTFYLIKYRPGLVVSFGSYVSTPVLVAAWLIGIRSITHEQASKVGLANKINSLFAAEFFSAWPTKDIENSQTIGNLTRSAVFKNFAASSAVKQFLKSKKKLIYITGGSIGSYAINNVIFNMADKFGDFKIIHQLGTANYKNDHGKANNIKSSNYLSLPYINDSDIGAVLKNSYIIISRAGANTTWELAVLGKPCILIPLPISGANEQYFNAKLLQKAGFAKIIDQKDLSQAQLTDAIGELDKNYKEYEQNARAFSKTLNLNAAEIMTDKIIKYLYG